MKFNPLTAELYTDGDVLLKKLHCPLNVQWQELKKEENQILLRSCSVCNHEIYDTAQFSEEQIVDLLRQNPRTCLKVDLNQKNIKIIHHGIYEGK